MADQENGDQSKPRLSILERAGHTSRTFNRYFARVVREHEAAIAAKKAAQDKAEKEKAES